MRLLLALTLAGLVCGLAARRRRPAERRGSVSAGVCAPQGSRFREPPLPRHRARIAGLPPRMKTGAISSRTLRQATGRSRWRCSVSRRPSGEWPFRRNRQAPISRPDAARAGACAGAGSGAPRRIPERESQRSRRKHDGGGERRPVSSAPAVTDPASANEAFLMNGTVSSGLAQPVPPDEGMGRPGMEPGGFGQARSVRASQASGRAASRVRTGRRSWRLWRRHGVRRPHGSGRRHGAARSMGMGPGGARPSGL